MPQDAWFSQIVKRNKRETVSFVETVSAYENLLREKRSIEHKLENAEREARYLRHENAMSGGGQGTSAGNASAPGISTAEREELKSLREKVVQLQEQLNTKLMSQYEIATSKLELTATSEELKSRLHETQKALIQNLKYWSPTK